MNIVVVDRLAFNCKWFKYIAYERGVPVLCLKNTERGRASASHSSSQTIRLRDTKIEVTEKQFEQICEQLNKMSN